MAMKILATLISVLALTACSSVGPVAPTNARTSAAATQNVAVIDGTARHYYQPPGAASVAGRRAFESLACDLGAGPLSQPWLNGGYPARGQELFIPDAIGTRLPDGSRHDGFFRCVESAPDLSGAEIAVFVGPAGSDAAAARATPFRFAKSMAGRSVQILVLP